MAQTGYTPLQIYSSSTASAAPAAGNLTNSTLGSELAINITDGKLFYKDNAGVVQVIGWKVVPATAGGTGLTSYTQGDLLYATSSTTLGRLADVATGNALISGGVGGDPAWGKIGLTTHVSGVLPTANGGTNLSSFTANGVLYASSTSALATASSFTFNGTTLSLNSGAAAMGIGATGDNTYHFFRTIDNAGQSIYIGNDNAAGSFFGAGAYGRVIYSEGANPIYIYTNATRRVMFGASGGVSIGNSTDPGSTNLSVTGTGAFGTTLSSTAATGGGALILNSSNANTSARNWAINANNQVYGDLSILQSNALGGDPIAAGTVRMYFGRTGGVSVGDTTDPGVGNLRLGTGNLVIGTSGKGIDFSATPGTGTSELFNDYEEGTWTPGVTGDGGSAGSVAFTSLGYYTKVGRTVTLNGYVLFTNLGSWTGRIQITGVPFSANVLGCYGSAWITFATISNAFSLSSAIGTVNLNAITFPWSSDAGAGGDNIRFTNLASNSFVAFTITYITT